MDKKQRVFDAIVAMFREFGNCSFGIDTVSERTGVSVVELFDSDRDTGILVELHDAGKVILGRGNSLSVELDWDAVFG